MISTRHEPPVVAIELAPSYEEAALGGALDRALARLGGLERFVRPGMRVFLKPNLLSAKEPHKAVTTHPALVRAVAARCRALGARVAIGDSPAGALKGIRRVWKKTGMEDVAAETGASLVSLESSGVVERAASGRRYLLSRAVLEADLVINLPKLKTHGLTLFTGAVKNTFGTIPGLGKGEYHKRFPHPDTFAEILVDVHALVAPRLHVMDGILAMEGNGPASGAPRHLGLLLAAEDGVALDAVASAVIGFRPEEIDTTRLAWRRRAAESGAGPGGLEGVRVAGVPLDEVRVHDFTLPSNRLLKIVPETMLRLAGRLLWVRPRAHAPTCIGCTLCATSCPVDTITMVDRLPVVDYARCINCITCQEVCPTQAMRAEASPLARLLL
jgi:uncharacterized protein (DUF362 family)/Pyruvate/2-oxoacid:ferredoxin oxidoreductase delta subunit